MKYFILFALCVAATQAHSVKDGSASASQVGGRIHHGQNAVIGQFPYMVTFLYDRHDRAWCGGALISDKWVISVAQCTTKLPITALLGHVDWPASDPVTREVIKVVYHPAIELGQPNVDLSLMELNDKVIFSDRVQPIRLARPDDLFVGEIVTVSSFGSTHNLEYPDNLQYGQQRVISHSACQAIYFTLGENLLCTVGYPTQQHDYCYGDSGSPLIARRPDGDVLIGIFSVGNENCDGQYPGIHEKPHFFLEWIKDVTELDL